MKLNINKKIKNRCILIPKTAVKKNSIYGSHLGKLKGLENMTDKIENDCRINYVKYFDRYELLVTLNIPQKIIHNRENIVALDPGEKYL